MSQEAALTRMTNLSNHLGQEGLEVLAGQSALFLGMTLVFFILCSEIWIRVLEHRVSSPTPTLMVRFWSIFLLLPLFALGTRLLGLDLWAGLMGNPGPSLAQLAISGFESDATGALQAQEEDLRFFMIGRAGQTLLPALILCGAAYVLFEQGRHRLSGPKTQPSQGLVMIGGALLLGWTALPIVLNTTLWAAWFGNYVPLLEAIYTQTPRSVL